MRLAGHTSHVPASVNILIKDGLSIPVNEGSHSNVAMQTVSIGLRQVKEPFPNIVIPQNEGEVIKFERKNLTCNFKL